MRRRFDGCVSVYKSGARDEPVDPSSHNAPSDYSSADNPTTNNSATNYTTTNYYSTPDEPRVPGKYQCRCRVDGEKCGRS